MLQPIEHNVMLEITCLRPPTWQGVFGLQDKDKRLNPPVRKAGRSAVFRCEVRAKRGTASDSPNFLGTFTHGTPKHRFLYLSLRPAAGPDDAWIRRIKVPLKGITWEQVEATVGLADARLACTVDGVGAGTVRLIGGGWKILRD